MTFHVNDGGTWKSAIPYVNDGGTWKRLRELWVNDGGTWKRTFRYPEWANISGTGVGTISAANAAETMPQSGTLNFSTSFPGSYQVFKNGVDQGQVASLAVAGEDTVYFRATATPGPGATSSGTFTVSGAIDASFTITIRDTTGT